MKFKPLHDRVVVKRIDSDEKSAGGIIISLKMTVRKINQ